MKSLFDGLSVHCSRMTTETYSTSFSLGILFLSKDIRNPIHGIYGFVRLADEIVDSFHGYDRREMLESLEHQTWKAIENRISINPILNTFQSVVHQYRISHEWIKTFLRSMEMDLYNKQYDERGLKEYILGSAEVVGLMCLHVFTKGDMKLFRKLKPYAMRLGAAFQKVNFLRDIQADTNILGRTYFPEIDIRNFSQSDKRRIEKEIEEDLTEALKGIRLLPSGSKSGVYLAYYYYSVLFRKIRNLPAEKIMEKRIRIPNFQKLLLMVVSNLRYKLNLL
jgi:15-cis-phytoene synthase